MDNSTGSQVLIAPPILPTRSFSKHKGLAIAISIIGGLAAIFAFLAYFQVSGSYYTQTTYALLASVSLNSVSLILFYFWIYRAYKNRILLGDPNPQFTAGWVVGWFFIPVASYFMPCKALYDIWKNSSFNKEKVDSKDTQDIHFVGWFWTAFLFYVIFTSLSTYMMNSSSNIFSLYPLVGITFILALIAYVLSVTMRQYKQNERQSGQLISDFQPASQTIHTNIPWWSILILWGMVFVYFAGSALLGNRFWMFIYEAFNSPALTSIAILFYLLFFSSVWGLIFYLFLKKFIPSPEKFLLGLSIFTLWNELLFSQLISQLFPYSSLSYYIGIGIGASFTTGWLFWKFVDRSQKGHFILWILMIAGVEGIKIAVQQLLAFPLSGSMHPAFFALMRGFLESLPYGLILGLITFLFLRNQKRSDPSTVVQEL